MSIQIRAGRARRPMGDPGLFGFLGGAISKVAGLASKVLPGPLGSAAGLVSNLTQKKAATPTRAMPGTGTTSVVAVNRMAYNQTPPPQLATMATTTNPFNVQLPSLDELKRRLGLQGGGTDVVPYQRPTDMSGITTPPPGPGYRPNKSGYWRRDPRDASGMTALWIPPNSIWVKTRRRNPLNPRAADRAISRLTSAKRAVQKLSRITVRESKPCRR